MAFQTLDGNTALPVSVIPATFDADPGCEILPSLRTNAKFHPYCWRLHNVEHSCRPQDTSALFGIHVGSANRTMRRFQDLVSSMDDFLPASR